MKKILLLTLLSIGLISCSNEDLGTDNSLLDQGADLAQKNGNGNSGSSYSDYGVHVSVNEDGSLWTYTIAKSKANAKNLSHFIIDLNNCGEESASFANIIYATVNGLPADLSPTEGAGTGCNPQAITNNFIKINVDGNGPWVLVIKFERGYEVAEGTSWIKAGTGCNSATTLVPGCPREDYCSFSQGFFFANGSVNNGANVFWGSGLTIGGVTYSHEEGRQMWSIDRGQGGSQALNGFFQLGAVKLSGVESEVQANADIVEAYYAAIGNVFNYLTVNNPQYFNLPSPAGGYTTAQVAVAGGAIGNYIDENHCQD